MTTPLWSCPACGFANAARVTRCKSCDEMKPGSRSGRDVVVTDRCAWSWGPGRQCWMPVEGWPGQNPVLDNRRQIGWCAWHLDVKQRPRWADDREEFDRWWQHWYERPIYCCTWTHFPRDVLWQAVQGQAPLNLHGDPCRVGHCPNQAEESYDGPWPPTKAMWRALYDRLEIAGTGIERVPF